MPTVLREWEYRVGGHVFAFYRAIQTEDGLIAVQQWDGDTSTWEAVLDGHQVALASLLTELHGAAA